MKRTLLSLIGASAVFSHQLFAQGRGGAAVPVDSPVVSFGPTPRVALLVGEKNGGRLAIIDPVKLEVVARIPVGGNFHELATDGRYAYMGTNLPGITVADVAAQKRVESIEIGPYGNFHGLFVAAGKLYVGHEQNRLISRYDPATKKFDWFMGLAGGPHLFKVTEDERTIFAPSSNGRVISILESGGGGGAVAGATPAQQVAINVLNSSFVEKDAAVAAARTEVVRASLTDRSTVAARVNTVIQLELALAGDRADAFARLQGTGNRLNATQAQALAAAAGRGGAGGGRGGWTVTTFPGDTRMEGFDLSPDGKEFWAINMNAKSLTIINVPEKKVVQTVPFEGGLNNRIKFTLDGKFVLMNELQGTALRVWDVATRTEVKKIEVGAGGEGVFMDPDGVRAYYAVSNGNKLAVIDVRTMTVIKEIPDLLNPDGMAWYIRSAP